MMSNSAAAQIAASMPNYTNPLLEQQRRLTQQIAASMPKLDNFVLAYQRRIAQQFAAMQPYPLGRPQRATPQDMSTPPPPDAEDDETEAEDDAGSTD